MKRTVMVEQILCDVCQKNEAYKWNACLNCGKHICYDCRKTDAHEYPHGVHVGGSGDGIYCNECDAALIQSDDNPMHKAYRVILALRNEATGFYADFNKRSNAAEAVLKKLQDKAD